MLKFFAEKNVSSFCNAKATHIFSAKNFRILYIESAKTVNEMTLNELVKLTTLWTTGPRWAPALPSYIIGIILISTVQQNHYIYSNLLGHLNFFTDIGDDRRLLQTA